MRNSFKKIAVAAGAAAAAVTLGATTATAGVAAPTWTVGPSSPLTASAASTGTVTLSLNGIPLTCTTSAATAALKTASGTTGVTVGTIAPLTWSGCTSPFGPVTPTANTTTPWGIVANTYASGVTTGYISKVNATLKVLTCTFTVTGDVPATYNNSTGQLKAASTAASTYKLTVATASAGCAGIAAVGQNPLYTATYNVVKSGTTTKPTIVYTP
ncbi:hypothetical protein [Streptomyces sp. HB132]|uniref:hypothetical protein n=1 Tax=Streptomyces sp. HB132 TaxID=767388 RepID=UPI00195FCF00|nr:hypothetical protein [Streptomyces sp. HB132]MBM7442551.1 hypothetical protein [Streptomyces sp. HB132]